ncbi:hypothetical protein TWF730_010076 [Orbilia blumenaviensis]|uniref:Transmembrane protein n=1 Tax=Orbilia blumenaviensis TaxID=1796055 RepID=A0AAV9UXS2_9PEZI
MNASPTIAPASPPAPLSEKSPAPTGSADSKAEDEHFGKPFMIGLGSIMFAFAFFIVARACVRKMRGGRGDGRDEFNPPTPPPEDLDWRPPRRLRPREPMWREEYPQRPIVTLRDERMQLYSPPLLPLPEGEEMGVIRRPNPVARLPGSRIEGSRTNRPRRQRQPPPARAPSIADSEEKPPSYRSGTRPPTYEDAWDGRA